jgi:hypothetical protein
MRFSTKRGPTADHWRLRPEAGHNSAGFHSATRANRQAEPNEPDRVLAILAMGSNGVPPLLVRRAIDEQWSVEQAARMFKELVKVG